MLAQRVVVQNHIVQVKKSFKVECEMEGRNVQKVVSQVKMIMQAWGE